MRLPKLLLMTVAISVTSFFYGNAQTVTGKVNDANTGEPVSGATVMVRSTRAGTTTADDGSFSVQAQSSDVLEISRIGYKTLQVNIDGRTSLVISFESTAAELGQIVLVGSRRGGRVRTE